MQMRFDFKNGSIYEALKSLRIREDLNMCKCTVSCILYHINANIEKKYKRSHTRHGLQRGKFFHVYYGEYGHKLGLLCQTIFQSACNIK